MKGKGNPFKQQGESWMVRNEESWFGLCSPFSQGSISWLCYLHCFHALTIKGGMICSYSWCFLPRRQLQVHHSPGLPRALIWLMSLGGDPARVQASPFALLGICLPGACSLCPSCHQRYRADPHRGRLVLVSNTRVGVIPGLNIGKRYWMQI